MEKNSSFKNLELNNLSTYPPLESLIGAVYPPVGGVFFNPLLYFLKYVRM